MVFFPAADEFTSSTCSRGQVPFRPGGLDDASRVEHRPAAARAPVALEFDSAALLSVAPGFSKGTIVLCSMPMNDRTHSRPFLTAGLLMDESGVVAVVSPDEVPVEALPAHTTAAATQARIPVEEGLVAQCVVVVMMFFRCS